MIRLKRISIISYWSPFHNSTDSNNNYLEKQLLTIPFDAKNQFSLQDQQQKDKKRFSEIYTDLLSHHVEDNTKLGCLKNILI